MRLGAHFVCEDLADYLEAVRLLEKSGYARAWHVDSQLLWQDPYVFMSRGLAASERLQLGIAASNPVTRHYTVAASAAATLAGLHPGRVILGLARGDTAVRTLGREPVATERMAEILRKVRALLGGEAVVEDGAEIRIRWAKARVPLMYAASGPLNLRLGGMLADIVTMQVGSDPAAVRWALGHVRAGAEAAGREPDQPEVVVHCGLWVADDRDEALAAMRWAAVRTAAHVRAVARRGAAPAMPEVMARIARALDDGTSALSPALMDALVIAGPADHCLSRIRALAELGVTEILAPHVRGARAQIARAGRELIPALAAPELAPRPRGRGR